jgi:hypothetical protein
MEENLLISGNPGGKARLRSASNSGGTVLFTPARLVAATARGPSPPVCFAPNAPLNLAVALTNVGSARINRKACHSLIPSLTFSESPCASTFNVTACKAGPGKSDRTCFFVVVVVAPGVGVRLPLRAS